MEHEHVTVAHLAQSRVSGIDWWSGINPFRHAWGAPVAGILLLLQSLRLASLEQFLCQHTLHSQCTWKPIFESSCNRWSILKLAVSKVGIPAARGSELRKGLLHSPANFLLQVPSLWLAFNVFSRFSVFPFCVQAILFGAWLHDADANAEECLSRCVTWVFWLPKILLVVELRDKVGCRWRWRSNVIRWLGITFVLQFPTLQLLILCRMHWPWCMNSWQARCKWAHASARCPFVPKVTVVKVPNFCSLPHYRKCALPFSMNRSCKNYMTICQICRKKTWKNFRPCVRGRIQVCPLSTKLSWVSSFQLRCWRVSNDIFPTKCHYSAFRKADICSWQEPFAEFECSAACAKLHQNLFYIPLHCTRSVQSFLP